MYHYEGPRKSGGTETDWDLSTSGMHSWYTLTESKHRCHKEKTQTLPSMSVPMATATVEVMVMAACIPVNDPSQEVSHPLEDEAINVLCTDSSYLASNLLFNLLYILCCLLHTR